MILRLATMIVTRAFEIGLLRSTGDDLPDSKSFALLAAGLSIPAVIGEQLASGHGVVHAVLVTVAWLLCVWMVASEFGTAPYRMASALFLGAIPACLVAITIAAGEIGNLLVGAWVAAVALRIIFHQK
jgi:hypothetical protein